MSKRQGGKRCIWAEKCMTSNDFQVWNERLPLRHPLGTQQRKRSARWKILKKSEPKKVFKKKVWKKKLIFLTTFNRHFKQILLPPLGEKTRPAILFWEKTFRIKNWKQKSAHFFSSVFGRFSRFCSDFDGGRGIDEPPKWLHFYIFCASASAKVCRVILPKLAGSDFELSHTIFKCWQTHEIHQLECRVKSEKV